MVIDSSYATETALFEEGEELVGFEFDSSVQEQLGINTEARPERRIIMPGEEDSISTLRSKVKESCLLASVRQVQINSSQVSCAPTLSSGHHSILDERIE